MRNNAITSATLKIVAALIALASSGASHADWKAGSEWTVDSPNSLSVTADKQTEAWDMSTQLGSSWAITADISVARVTSISGDHSARFLFGGPGGGAKVIVGLTRHAGTGFIGVDIDYLGKTWRPVLRSGWLPGSDTAFAILVSRVGDSIKVSVFGDQGMVYQEECLSIPPAVLKTVSRLGVAASGGAIHFSNMKVRDTFRAPSHYSSQAEAAMDLMMEHYWVGGPDSGHITWTHDGYAVGAYSDRKPSWQQGMMVFAMDALYQKTGDPILKRRLQAEWNWTKQSYTAAEMQTAGPPVHPASDDTGWDALTYFLYYQDLGDPVALDMAKGLVDSGFKRWMTGDLGGGLWYSDKHGDKSLYGVGIIYDALRIYEATHDQSYYDRALSCYNWIEGHLLRSDNAYWCGFGATGPVGKERPNDIGECGSVSFLGGNIAMGVLHAWFYRHTNDPIYLDRAKRTADAISTVFVRDGVYVDDRDAWANGTFFGEWAADVLTLPGLSPKHKKILLDTSDSIETRDRTRDGYYGGCWHGPAEGPGSKWGLNGSRPQQIMTCSSTAILLMGAALAAGD